MNDSEGQSDAEPSAYLSQLARTYRFLDRYRARQTTSDLFAAEAFNDMEDFLWSFFQNCWHVNDWIRNDEKLDRRLRDKVWNEVNADRSLQIVADLANGSKHFARSPNRERVGAAESQLTINLNVDGTYAFVHEVTLNDGSVLKADQIALDAMRSWREILTKLGMYHYAEPTA